MAKKTSRFRRIREGAQALWEERGIETQDNISKIQKFAHFWIMVWRSFTRNRCPVRASALAYTTLLAIIPMLAVVMSITSTFLKKEGEDKIDQFIVKIVASVTPEAPIGTNEIKEILLPKSDGPGDERKTNQTSEATSQKSENTQPPPSRLQNSETNSS